MPKVQQKGTSKNVNIPGRKLKNINCIYCQRTFFIKDPYRIEGPQVPVLRYCGHTMCEKCSTDIAKLSCPRCEDDSTTSISQHPIPALNFYAVGLMLAQNSRPVGIPVVTDDEFIFPKSMSSMIHQISQCCSECKKGATCRCLGCTQLYCNGCFEKIHSFNSLKSHDRVSLKHEENTSPQLEIVCKIHTRNIFKHWCRECNVRCCPDCIVYEHRTHSTIEIQKMNELCEKEFRDAYEKLVDTIGQVHIAKKEVDAALKFPEEVDNSAKVESEINQHFLYLYGILQNLESQMIENLHAQSNGRLRSLIEIQEELQSLETELQDGILLANSAKAESASVNHMEIINQLKELENVRCYLLKRQLNNEEKESIMFQADKSIVAAIKDHCLVDTKALPKLFSIVAANELPEDYMIKTVARESLSIPLLSVLSPPLTPSTSDEPIVENYADSVILNSSIPIEISSRRGYEVHVTYICNPYCFYVREKRDDDLYEQVERELQKYSTKNEIPLEKVTADKLYVVNGTRHKWYRGYVRSISTTDYNPPSVIYETHAVDHGFVHKVDKTKLRTLSRFLTEIPPLAKKHKLFDIFPINGKSWSTESIEEMRNIVSIASEKLPRLYEVFDEEGGSDLLIPTTIHNDALSVRDTLLFLGHGKFESTEKLLKLNPSASNVYHHDQLELDTYYEIVCLHVESPTCFYVRKANYNEDYFKKMIEDMTQVYKTTKKVKSLIHNPVIGLNCAAPHNGSWHRGVISNIPGVKKVEVFFVDIGIKSTMNYDKIRRLDPCFTRASTRAIKLSLKDVEIPDGDEGLNIKTIMTEFMNPTAKIIISAAADDCYIASVLDCNNISLRCILNSDRYIGPRTPSSSAKKSFMDSPKMAKSKLKGRIQRNERNNNNLFEFINLYPVTSQKKTDVEPQPEQDPYLCRVNIIHVVSPDEIYVATTHRTETFDEIHNKMQLFYTKQKSKGSPDIFKGAVCAARLPRNNAYYRAEIVEMNNDNVKVFCIDEGKYEIIPNDCIQSLAPELHAIPVYLFKVRLGGIIPTCGVSTWTSVACEELIEIINRNETKNFFIAKVEDSVNEPMTVDLYVEQVNIIDPISPPVVEKILINRMLIEVGLALPIKGYNDNKLKVLATDVKKEMNFHDENVVKQLYENLCSDTGISQEPQGFTEDPPRDNSNSFPIGIATWRPAENILVNSFRAHTTYIDWDAFIYLHSLEQTAALRRIEEQLQDNYTSREVCESDRWSPGDMCITKYHASEKWCRGVVHEVCGEFLSVEFVDYGNLEWQERKTLHKEIMLEDVPRIANKCKIYGLISNSPNRQWDESELHILHSVTVDRDCTVTILRRNEGYNIIKLNCIQGLDRDLIAYLVDNKMNIRLDDMNSDCNSDIVSNSSADIHTESNENVDNEDGSADVVIEGIIEDYTDENADDDDIESNDESNDGVVQATLNAMIENILNSEKLKYPIIMDNSNESREKSDSNEDDEDYSDDVEKEYFKSDEIIHQSCLPDIYRSIFEDFQLPNNDSKYMQLILPDEITEFHGAIGEVDTDKSNIVWLHPSTTKKGSVLNYYRTAYMQLQLAMDLEADQQPLLENVNAGTPCCAPYSGMWHRGSIVSPLILSGMIEVLYVDWGNIGLVEINQIHTMKREWFHVPTLAIKCRLWNTQIADNVRARNWLQYKRDDSPELYKIRVVGRESDHVIAKIFDKNCDERLMYQDLIDQKIFLNNTNDFYYESVPSLTN